ncbi:MAG TPA: winged helix DNA-binding domain-containing protein [Solirubrobacteraceae bacterium]|nr:winged helix DNA-binding domain-containing protein [Solirubrobacteraceae bacterium]
MTALGWEQVRAWRVRRHGLEVRAPAGAMLELASRLCGVHAQLMGSAELTLWARLEDLDPDAVATALWQDRTLVKTWAMRGTLHLLPADELGLWHAGLGTYRHYLKPAWLRAFDITEPQLLELIDAVSDALGGEPLTRAELAGAVVERTGDESLREKLGHGFGVYLKPAAFRGRLCFGPGDGQKVRFTRPDVWLGHAIDRPEPEAALREIARRYLAVQGPATRDDLRRWWATTPAAAGKLLRSLEDAEEVEVDGEPLWMLSADAREAAALGPAGGVRLLPAFDQYVIAATRQAEHFLPGDFRDRIYRPQGWLSPVVLVDGVMAGVWRHERRGRRVELAVEPFGRLSAAQRGAVADEAERLAAHLRGELALGYA